MSDHGGTHHQHPHAEAHGEHHVIPTFVYYRVFAALMVLLVLTLAAAAFDLGPLNIAIAVTIAVIKAVLILLYFMHLRFSTPLVQVFGGAALFWLLIMFALTLTDYVSRN
jgi:cytochrome c oxidase subunit 4